MYLPFHPAPRLRRRNEPRAKPTQSQRIPRCVPLRVGGVSPAFSSRASEALGSVHTDLGDISRAATEHELNLTRRALKATYAIVRQTLKEEEEERNRLEEKRRGWIRTRGLQIDEDVLELISATKNRHAQWDGASDRCPK